MAAVEWRAQRARRTPRDAAVVVMRPLRAGDCHRQRWKSRSSAGEVGRTRSSPFYRTPVQMECREVAPARGGSRQMGIWKA